MHGKGGAAGVWLHREFCIEQRVWLEQRCMLSVLPLDNAKMECATGKATAGVRFWCPVSVSLSLSLCLSPTGFLYNCLFARLSYSCSHWTRCLKTASKSRAKCVQNNAPLSVCDCASVCARVCNVFFQSCVHSFNACHCIAYFWDLQQIPAQNIYVYVCVCVLYVRVCIYHVPQPLLSLCRIYILCRLLLAAGPVRRHNVPHIVVLMFTLLGRQLSGGFRISYHRRAESKKLISRDFVLIENVSQLLQLCKFVFNSQSIASNNILFMCVQWMIIWSQLAKNSISTSRNCYYLEKCRLSCYKTFLSLL